MSSYKTFCRFDSVPLQLEANKKQIQPKDWCIKFFIKGISAILLHLPTNLMHLS